MHARGGQSGEDVPLPATVIIDRNGRVRWVSVTNNFQVRPDPDLVARVLREL